jgi:hypothetical protein
MGVASGVDWGNVPAWVGSVLSGMSLLLALLILLKDKRRYFRAQASQLNAFLLIDTGPGGIVRATVQMHNASSSVMARPCFVAWPTRS